MSTAQLQTPQRFVMKRAPRTDDELWWTMQALWGYRFPRTPVCPEHSTPFAAIAEAYFARAPVTLWIGSRGFGGKSRALGILAMTELACLGAEVTVLGGSGAQSLNVQATATEAWAHYASPKSLLMSPPTKYDTFLTNDGHMRSLMASQTSVRGPHPQRLRLDEIDEMDLAILEAAQGQPMRKRGIETQTVMCVVAGTKITTQRGVIDIVDVGGGDKVLTRSGWRSVDAMTYSGMKPVVEVNLSNGETLVCTDDHRIATGDDEWMTPSEMSVGQILVGLHPPVTPLGRGGTALSVPAHPRSGPALLALTPASGSTDEGVLGRVLMSLGAMGLLCVLSTRSDSTQHVRPGRDGLKVGGVAARTDTAQMVDGVVVGDIGIDKTLPCPSVNRPTMDCAIHPAVPTTNRTLPYPTSVAVDDTPIQEPVFVVDIFNRSSAHVPVYDLSVDDVHEFTAHGIVIHNSSTWQNPDGTVTEMLKRANERSWPVHRWCWRETSNKVDGWLTQEEVARKRQEITKHMWESEYDLQEPNTEGRAIDHEALERCFDKAFGEFTGDRPVLARPIPGIHYITGIDWAKEQDQTIVATFDTSHLPWVCVGWQKMQRQPWPVMIRKALAQWRHFGSRGKLVHDATGIGNVVEDIIREELTSSEQRYIKGIVMGGGRERHNLFNDYISGIESDDIRYPMIHFPYTEHKYVDTDALFGRGHPPDSVVAGALAWSQRKHKLTLGLPDGGVRGSNPWKV